MPDRIKSTQFVEEDCFDFICGIEDLYPLLGEQKQHIQGRVTWSESKLMIGEEERFNVRSDDGFHNLAHDWEKADWSVVAGICFCTFLCRAVIFTPGVGLMVRVVGLRSSDPEFKSSSAVELISGGVNSACHPSEVGKMSASILVDCVGVATRPGLCPIAKETA